MKMYYVGVNMGAGTVNIVKEDTKNLASPENPSGIRYARMFYNQYYSMMYMDTSKKRCMQYIKKNYPDFDVYDDTEYNISSYCKR